MQSTESTSVQRLESGAYRVSGTSHRSSITGRYVVAARGSRDPRIAIVPSRTRD